MNLLTNQTFLAFPPAEQLGNGSWGPSSPGWWVLVGGCLGQETSRRPAGPRERVDSPWKASAQWRAKSSASCCDNLGKPEGKGWVSIHRENFWLSKGQVIWKKNLVGGWVDLPLWKMMEWKSVGMITFPIYEQIKHVPNHQPVSCFLRATLFAVPGTVQRWVSNDMFSKACREKSSR